MRHHGFSRSSLYKVTSEQALRNLLIDMGDRLLIAKSDPITFATDAIGYYAVTVNANDIAVMGGTPRWFLATLLLPETRTTAALVQDIFAQIRQACRELGITLVGGHTEITVGLERPILSGHMLGEVTRERLVTSAGVQVGMPYSSPKVSPSKVCPSWPVSARPNSPARAILRATSNAGSNFYLHQGLV